MPRPSVIRAALAGLLTAGVAAGGLAAPTAAAPKAPPAAETDPLVVHLDTISPELPPDGDVMIGGTVTNVSDETFTRVNLHAFASELPILDDLTASTLVDTRAFVGERVTTPGTFATVDVLAPGESAEFFDSVPVELLGTSGQPGVYWIGIHALGDSSVPRDDVADGRARTFIPMRPTGRRTQEASVVLTIRNRVWFDEDGAVAGTDRWARRLAEGGSLDGVLDMAESAGSTPYSWLVDPAVLLALARLADGNRPRTLDPDPNVPDQQPTPTEEPTETPDEGGTEVPPTIETLTPGGSTPTEDPSTEEAELAAAASAWLARFRLLVGATPVMTLPYGDIDVSAAMRHDRTRFEEAVARAAEVMAGLTLPTRPAVAPLGDRLSPEAIAQLPAETLILLGDNAFEVPPESRSSMVRLLGHKVLVTSSEAEAGGPGPTAANDALALRQRLLSEAALRLNNRDRTPLVVTLPTVWRGEDAAAFFSDLEQSWLDVVPVGDLASQPATGVPASGLVYTPEDVEAELDVGNFSAATRATAASTLLEQVLSLVTRVETQVRDEVLVTLSEQHRSRPGLARLAAGRVEDSLRDELAKVTVEVPTAVTLSSDSGALPATLVNGLDQPVAVTLQVRTDGEMTLTGDGMRELGPRARSVVRFRATANQGGVHNVRLTVTSLDGVPLGGAGELPIRAARVSALIWIAMVVAGLVLFGMIGYRLPGQVRARRAELAAAKEQLEQADEPEPGVATPVPERP